MSKKPPIGYEPVGKRPDSVGLFWSEPKPIKAPPVEKVKRTPPEPTWLDEDFLPTLDEALAWEPDIMFGDELWKAAAAKERVVFDIELYPNYFLVMFKSLETGKICYFEKTDLIDLATDGLRYAATQFCLVGFNSRSFDIPILTLALNGASLQQLNEAMDFIIKERWHPYEVLRHYKCRSIDFNSIDLIEVAPLRGSLKEYGGRMHTRHMQDLPFAPGVPILKHQVEKFAILRYYCGLDLTNTEDLYKHLEKDIKLREEMGLRYGLDLRSKSDSQIAEAVIASEWQRRTGHKPGRTEIMPFTCYHYQAPGYLRFKTQQLQDVFSKVCTSQFFVSEYGNILLPKNWKEDKKAGDPGMKFTFNETTYQMGIGGLHSCEANVAHFSDDNYILVDRDVTSYYPFIILNQGLYPEHLGKPFLDIYKRIVDTRLHAKKTGDKRTADSLKITINGTFGKLGNKYSIMYSPRLMLQVTVSGQLSLLYLIEKIELAGIRVVSANTDGIVIKCPQGRKSELDAIVREWELETNFNTEETEYAAILSRSVNDYIAVKKDGTSKGKGGLGWGISPLFKNPVNGVCIIALEKFLGQGTAIERTVHECRDVRSFVSVRKVTGGAVWRGAYLGRAVRWYYSTESEDEIIYAKSGNKVSRSDGAKPLMILPDQLPHDIDFDRYISEAYKMLEEAGYPVSGAGE